ncbi:MAG: hypothetical protein B7Z66_12760 [Chromatiales bacterium 21-64-14]|nr:MAG: hypothetical protein B7Z66_12760 [Chromatiales bacterium 21-64-14]HQU15746.1 DUF4340 domain-containing protein [Gammaproteobacteria bacterium]
MRSRTLLNLVLAATVLGLALVVHFRPGREKPPPPPPLTPLAPHDITAIAIERPGHPAITLAKTHGRWRITAPLQARANQLRVDGVEAAAAAGSLAHYSAARLNLKGVDLDPPKARLRLNQETIKFGGTDPINQWRYVQIGDTVHLINDTVYPFLTMGPTGFVDLTLLPEETRILSLRLPALHLRRNANGDWTLDPPQPKVTADQIQALVNRWHDAQALDVQRYHAGKSLGEIVVHLQGRKTPVRFILQETDPELVLARPAQGLSYHLDGALSKHLLALPPSNTPTVPKASGNAGGNRPAVPHQPHRE